MRNCPKDCEVKLLMTERLGVEIDYCPECRGVWLDRGELDKIIDRVEQDAQARMQAQAPVQQPQAPYQPNAPHIPTQVPPPPPQPVYRYDDDDDDYYRKHGHYKKKRKGLLGELFDFD